MKEIHLPESVEIPFDELTTRQKLTFIDWHDYTLQEIMDTLHVEASTVRGYMEEARKKGYNADWKRLYMGMPVGKRCKDCAEFYTKGRKHFCKRENRMVYSTQYSNFNDCKNYKRREDNGA